MTRTETIYAICRIGPTFDPVYVGKTSADPKSYWQHVHVRNYYNGISKRLYEAMRYEGGIGNFELVVLGTTDDGLTEADWVTLLTAEGHTLHNANGGNKKVAAPTDPSKVLFRDLNRKALKALGDA